MILFLVGCAAVNSLDTAAIDDPGLLALPWAVDAGDSVPQWASALEREYGADQWPAVLEFSEDGAVLIDGSAVEQWGGGDYTGETWGGWPVREYTVAGERWEAAGAGEDPYGRTWAIDADGLVFGLYPHPG